MNSHMNLMTQSKEQSLLDSQFDGVPNAMSFDAKSAVTPLKQMPSHKLRSINPSTDLKNREGRNEERYEPRRIGKRRVLGAPPSSKSIGGVLNPNDPRYQLVNNRASQA